MKQECALTVTKVVFFVKLAENLPSVKVFYIIIIVIIIFGNLNSLPYFSEVSQNNLTELPPVKVY